MMVQMFIFAINRVTSTKLISMAHRTLMRTQWKLLRYVYYPARLEGEYYPVEEERRQAEGRSMVHFCESVIPGRATTRSNSGNCQSSNSVEKISSNRTAEDGTAELFEPVSSVYHTARMKREGSHYSENPSTDSELRTKERRILQFETEDSEDEDVSEARRRRTRKTKTDAKVSKTQHSSRHFSDSARRAIEQGDAKVSSTQQVKG